MLRPTCLTAQSGYCEIGPSRIACAVASVAFFLSPGRSSDCEAAELWASASQISDRSHPGMGQILGRSWKYPENELLQGTVHHGVVF